MLMATTRLVVGSPPLLLALVVLVNALQTITEVASSNSGTNQLSATSFQLRANQVRQLADGRQELNQFFEKYSHQQRRGLVNFRRTLYVKGKNAETNRHQASGGGGGGPIADLRRGVLFIDKQLDTTLILERLHNKCHWLGSTRDLSAQMNLDFADDLPLEHEHTDHLFGASRLLYYVLENRKNQRLVMNNSTVRGIPCHTYQMSAPSPESGQPPVELLVSFYSASLSSQADALPIRIAVATGSGGGGDKEEDDFIEYTHVKFLQEDEFNSKRLASQELQDRFSLVPFSNCQQALPPGYGLDLFGIGNGTSGNSATTSTGMPWSQWRGSPRQQFSFRADVEYRRSDRTSVKMNAVVAYDAQLKSMRVELAPGERSEGHGRSLLQVFSFKHNRIYQMSTRATGGSGGNLREDANGTIHKFLPADWVTTRGGSGGGGGDDGQEKVHHCASGRLVEPVCNSVPSIDRLLTGAEKRQSFLYLGKARVRGLRARLYEAIQVDLPYWLERPSETAIDGSSIAVRPTGRTNIYDGEQFVTLVYLSDEDRHRQESHLLRLETYRTDSSLKSLYNKRAIDFYDFTWTLSAVRAGGSGGLSGDNQFTGGQIGSLFSLGDTCFAENNYDAQRGVQLVLESESGLAVNALPHQLDNAADRNLALLINLQDRLRLSVASISDLESRLIEGKLIKDERGAALPSRKLLIAANFHTAPYPRRLAGFEFVGRGRRSSADATIAMRSLSFRACSMAAAQRDVAIQFAYNFKTLICYLARKPATASDDNETGFLLDAEGGQLDIYNTRFTVDSFSSVLNYWTHLDNVSPSIANLVNEPFFFNVTGVDGTRVLFPIKHLHTEAHRTALMLEGNRNLVLRADGKVDQIKGVGLSASDPNNEPIRPVPLHSSFINPFGVSANDSQQQQVATASSAMSLRQCQLICLNDLNCGSYSVCVRGALLECVLSRLTFSSSSLINEWTHLVNGLVSGAKFTVSAEQAQTGTKVPVELERHPICTLYNKHYSSFFQAGEQVTRSLYGLQLWPVGELDECARMCAQRNFDLVRSHSRELARLNESLAGEEQTNDNGHQVVDTPTAGEKRRSYMDAICQQFFFLDESSYKTLDANLTEKVQQFVVAEDEKSKFQPKEHFAGYCALATGPPRPPGVQSSLAEISVDAHNFKLDLLYEEEYGVSLAKSRLSPEEERAYEAVSGMARPAGVHLAILESVLRRGDNLQEISVDPRLACARRCLLQVDGPWPACRSFDIVISREGTGHLFRCRLNSITLNQAIAQDRMELIESELSLDSSSMGTQRWHYEPRPGMVLFLENNINFFDETTVGRQENGWNDEALCSAPNARVFNIGAILFFGLGTGLLAGLVFYESYLQHRSFSFLRRLRMNSLSSVAVIDLPGNILEPA